MKTVMTTLSASIQPANVSSENDSTVIILLGVLVPLSLIILICILCVYLRNQREKSQHPSLNPSKNESNQNPPSSSGNHKERISHGVTQTDLKFIVPHYNVYQTGMEGNRSQSPIHVPSTPKSRLIRHLSAPVGPSPADVPKDGQGTSDPRSRDSTPERPTSCASEETHGICVRMYTSESDGDSATTSADCDEDRYASPGKLCFHVEIDWQRGQLRVHLKQAQRLRSRSTKGSINPSIRVSIHPDPNKAKFHTRPHKSANPQLKETFTFQLPPQAMPLDAGGEEKNTSDCQAPFRHITHLKELEIRLELFHCDIFSRKSEVGLILFRPFEASQPSVPLTNPIFQTGGMEVWREFKNPGNPHEAERVSRGQVLISLCRDPDKKTLAIGILKGKDLNFQHAASGGDSSPLLFVKMALIQGGKVLKSKKTKSIKKTQNPAFNETFRFYVKTSWLDKISITISICTKPILGSSKLLGRVMIGPVMYACGSGLEHWNDMISVPKSGVAQWHNIC